MISDHKLRQDVLEELDFEPSLDASHIAVGVHDGVVTLSGSVPSYADKLAAERAAKHVFGVRAIAQTSKSGFRRTKRRRMTKSPSAPPTFSDGASACRPIGSRSRSRKAS